MPHSFSLGAASIHDDYVRTTVMIGIVPKIWQRINQNS